MTDLATACQALETAWDTLYEDLVTVARDTIHGHLLYRGMAGVSDIIGSASSLIDAHHVGGDALGEQARRLLPLLAGKIPTSEIGPAWMEALGDRGTKEALWKLGAAYKTVFYFVRAYQDTLYRMVLNLQKQPWGKQSMSRALRPDNPVGKLLGERLPEYLPWFEDWRDKRNKIKDGVTAGWAGPQTDPGLVFVEVIVTPGTYATRLDARTAIRLSDVAAAIEMSAQLTGLVHRLVKERQAGG
jgi:hypothetical protein